jgi:superfamily II DNA helicase RecQ
MTINPIVAKKFQHTEQTHNMFYSNSIIQKEGSTLVDYHLLLARVVWDAFGEPSTTPSMSSSPSNGGELREAQYNSAARTLYGAFSQTSQLQLEAIQHLDNTSVEGQSHAFVFMGTGTGKSGIYNISAAAAVLHGNKIQKTLVISPHNGLLAQHCQQSKTYFQSLPTIRVTSHDSTEISEQNDVPPDLDNTDLCFISIHGFQKLMKYHLNTFQQWGFERIIIDEYHNVISEIFRFDSSWDALSNIASLGTKILCMSATANEFIMQCIAKLLGLGTQYKVIGDIGRYRVPNVAILRSTVQY